MNHKDSMLVYRLKAEIIEAIRSTFGIEEMPENRPTVESVIAETVENFLHPSEKGNNIMHATETIEDRDLKVCLNDCQFKKYPFTFWDEKEVENFNLSALPVLVKGVQKDWRPEGKPITVDLSFLNEIKSFKALALKYIIGVEGGPQEVGFAITKVDRRIIDIQVYFS